MPSNMEESQERSLDQAEFNGYVKAKLEDIERVQKAIYDTLLTHKDNTEKIVDGLNKGILRNSLSIAGLKVKASFFGGLGGLVSVGIMVAVLIIKKLI